MNSRMRTVTAALITGIVACLSAFAQPADTTPLQNTPIPLPANVLLPTTLPYQTWEGVPTGAPIVIVSLDGSPVEHAAIATGLNANVIAPQVSLRLKLPGAAGRVHIGALNSSAVADQAEIQRFRAASLDLPKLVCAVADLPTILSQRPHQDVPAIWLGTPFLSAFQVTVDPLAQNLTLNKAGTPLRRTRGTSVVPLVLHDNRPYVHVTIPGAKPFLALFDTASRGTMIPTDVAEKLKIKPSHVEPVSWREGKPGKVAIVKLPKLNVGGAEWKTATVAYMTSDSSKEYDRTFAVIGMDLIRQYKVTIDFAHAQMALSPPEKPADATPSHP